MMKIAVPTLDEKVDNHFGHCAYYTIYTIEQNQIASKETLPSPQGCGCKSNIASTLQQMGVSVMLAGSMGEGAKNKLGGCNIRVIRGCSGETDAVVNDFLSGKIDDSGVGCTSHDDHHECSHH